MHSSFCAKFLMVSSKHGRWRTRDYVPGQCCACASSIILLQLQLQTRVRVSVVARLAVNKLRTLVDGDELMTQSREEGPKIRHHHVLLPPRSCQSLVLSFAALPLLLSLPERVDKVSPVSKGQWAFNLCTRLHLVEYCKVQSA